MVTTKEDCNEYEYEREQAERWMAEMEFYETDHQAHYEVWAWLELKKRSFLIPF